MGTFTINGDYSVTRFGVVYLHIIFDVGQLHCLSFEWAAKAWVRDKREYDTHVFFV